MLNLEPKQKIWTSLGINGWIGRRNTKDGMKKTMTKNTTAKKAEDIANEILEEKISPFDGCVLLSELSQKNNSPENLQIFELLAHEQYGHEHVSISPENTKIEIVEECKRLVNDQIFEQNTHKFELRPG